MKVEKWKFILVLCSGCVVGQLRIHGEELGGVSRSTRVDGPISGGKFVPPVPVPPKEIPAMRTESQRTFQVADRRITTMRGEPSDLPEIPRERPEELLTEAQMAERDAYFVNREVHVFLSMGATIYDQEISVVNWRHPSDPTIRYEAVAALDFSIFANVPQFEHKGIPHSLMLMHSSIDTKAPKRKWGVILRPDFPLVRAEGYLITKGDPTDAEGTAPIVALMALYQTEKPRLLLAHAERKKAHEEAKVWHKANPPPAEPDSVTIWIRPHRGSRYLDEKRGSR